MKEIQVRVIDNDLEKAIKDVYNRAVPFFKKNIENDLKEGKNVLIVASNNSLRALVKHIEKVSDNDIINLEIKTGEFKIYNNAEKLFD